MAQTSTLSDLIIAPHHTALSVQDFVAARDFFVKVLGSPWKARWTGAPASRRVVALPTLVSVGRCSFATATGSSYSNTTRRTVSGTAGANRTARLHPYRA